MKRWLTALVVLTVLGAVTIWAVRWGYGQVAPPIRVGLLHSRTGAMKISTAFRNGVSFIFSFVKHRLAA